MQHLLFIHCTYPYSSNGTKCPLGTVYRISLRKESICCPLHAGSGPLLIQDQNPAACGRAYACSLCHSTLYLRPLEAAAGPAAVALEGVLAERRYQGSRPKPPPVWAGSAPLLRTFGVALQPRVRNILQASFYLCMLSLYAVTLNTPAGKFYCHPCMHAVTALMH